MAGFLSLLGTGSVVVVVVSVGFVTCDARASASPVGHPIPQVEPSAGALVATDDPALVGIRPLPADAWSRGQSDDALIVQFWLGSPDCSGVHAVANETADSVTVQLQEGTHPAAVHRMCTMIVVPATLEVRLQAPLGSRTVLSAF